MHDDDPTADGEAELERLGAEIEGEASRVGVDWDAAQARMRELARQEWTPADDGESGELTLGFDVTALLRTLRRLPDGAGTEAFLAAFDAEVAGEEPPDA